MKNFFDIDGPFMRAMRDLMYLVVLNLLTLLCCVPIVTSGAALAAMHYVMMQMVEGTEGHIAKTFFKQFKANLRNATPIALIYIAAGVLLFFEFRAANQAGSNAKGIIVCIYALIFILLSLFVWVFPLTAKFVYSISAVFHNALYLVVSKLPRTIAMDAITVIVPMLFVNVPQLWPLAVFIGISLPSYLWVLIYFPVFKKIIKEKEGDDEGDN